jgi:transcriptional regulator with XRE-family HTH domain
MSTMTEIGLRIDEAQKEKKINNTELAKKLKISSPAISILKYKTKTPMPETIARVAKALGKAPEYFSARPAAAKAALEPAVAAPIAKAAVAAQPAKAASQAQAKPAAPKAQPAAAKAPPKQAAKAQPKQAAPQAKPQAPSGAAPDGYGLKTYVVVELHGKVISKKQTWQLPPDFVAF